MNNAFCAKTCRRLQVREIFCAKRTKNTVLLHHFDDLMIDFNAGCVLIVKQCFLSVYRRDVRHVEQSRARTGEKPGFDKLTEVTEVNKYSIPFV